MWTHAFNVGASPCRLPKQISPIQSTCKSNFQNCTKNIVPDLSSQPRIHNNPKHPTFNPIKNHLLDPRAMIASLIFPTPCISGHSIDSIARNRPTVQIIQQINPAKQNQESTQPSTIIVMSTGIITTQLRIPNNQNYISNLQKHPTNHSNHKNLATHSPFQRISDRRQEQ